ncbi:connector enhancer of ksr [Anopheles darlingi]|uniref:Connector enhancer of ksr n=1 Tax=Anopheles darlingi TaxID=43151 RepID=W5JEX0_ANODA|nr:connector enhancer of ksr [Anopheles darlingi]
MAYINVAEWSPDMVTDWLKGLDNSMYHYVQSFTNNGVGGKQLLNIRPYELEQLGMHLIGHQEIVLEAVENLKNFNYNLDKENLQFLALHVATAAHSLTKQLEYSDQEKLETAVLKDITRTITHLKALIEWLDRAPFKGLRKFDELRKQCMRFGLEMATVAMRDRFSLNPVQAIHGNAEKLAKIGEYIIKDITDPIILQPASLDLVTLKKRESDLGFLIMQSFHGIHRITEIKFNSPAHNSGKVEEGDEIVQINYQTVVGWEYKKVLLMLQESPPDVLLTLKKRPKHIKIYGQIYIKPYRLPSKKRSQPYRWGESLPSPRTTDTFALQDFSRPLERVPEKHVPSDTESEGSDILTPTDVKEAEKEIRLYLPKPRAVLQRRHTLSSFKDLVGVGTWYDRTAAGGKRPLASEMQSLRDKSVSFGFGLEMAPRPTTTCLGLVPMNEGEGDTGAPGKCASFGGLQSSLPDIIPSEVNRSRPEVSPNERSVLGSGGKSARDGPEQNGESDAYKAGVSKVVRFESSSKADECHVDSKYSCKVDSTVLETFEPIPYVDEDLPVVTAPENRPSVTERVRRFESFGNRSLAATITMSGHHGGSAPAQSAISSTTSTSATAPVKPIPMQRNLSKDPEALAEAINTVVVNREMVKRGRLDKSYSTPAYDDELGDMPPAIEPRKEHLLKTPPVPPPRPRRTLETLSGPLPEKPPQPAPQTPFSPEPGFVSSLSNALDNRDDHSNKSKLANVIDLKQNRAQPQPSPMGLGALGSTPPKPAERNATNTTITTIAATVTPSSLPPVPASRSTVTPPGVKESPNPTAIVPSIASDGSTSSELLTPNKTKSLTLKKKNSLLSKRRNVSLKTLCVSDIQGHLYRRTKDRSGVSYWAKYYFVLIETTLYGFRSKEAPKANSMIFLAGFTISTATEVHSRPHAFKVYHPNKTFYLAAETKEALVQWMEYIKQATLKGGTGTIGGSGGGGNSSTIEYNMRELFSETDSSDDELGLMDSTTKLNVLCTPSPQLSSSHSLIGGLADGTPTSTKQDNRYHLNFGSLKKFTKMGTDASERSAGTGTSTSSSGNSGEGSKFFGFFSHRSVEKSNSSEMPVPTSQFKSYRKVPGAGGLQIGTASTDAFPLPALVGTPSAGLNGTMSASNLSLVSVNGTTSAITPTPTAIASSESIRSQPPVPPPRPTTPSSPIPPTMLSPPSIVIREPMTPTISEAAELLNRARKSKRISPHNYIHASNPNLVEFDFQTSKAMDFSVPKIHAGNAWDTSTHSHSNLQSMITLKDLMLQKQAEEAQDMYNKRVCLGVEKLDERGKKVITAGAAMSSSANSEHDRESVRGSSASSTAPAIPEAVNKIQRRQLPITPDYAQSFKLDDEDILYTRSKEGQKLRDFGYEMISGDDAFDQRNRTNRSFSAAGGGSANGGAAVAGSSHSNGNGNGGGTSSGGSIKKKTFNWINSSDRRGTDASADRGSTNAGDGGSHSAVSSSSSTSGGPMISGGGSTVSLSLRDSFKRSKNKAVIGRLDNIKASSEKLFQFKQSTSSGGSSGSSNNNDKESLKTKQLDKAGAPSVMLMNVNLKHQPASIAFGVGGNKKNNNEINAALEHHSALLFQQANAGSVPIGGIKKSNTCNSSSDFKENSGKMPNMRKNSAPERSTGATGQNGGPSSSSSTASYFTSLSFGRSKTTKEKRWLSSPRFHRAIFGKNNHSNDHQPTVIDHEVFSPISYTKAPLVQQLSSSASESSTTMLAGESGGQSSSGSASLLSSTMPNSSTGTVLTTSFGPNGAVSRNSPDYPNMEYPPVFEPETYSLSDPNTSQTLLKRRQNHHHHPQQPHHQQHK